MGFLNIKTNNQIGLVVTLTSGGKYLASVNYPFDTEFYHAIELVRNILKTINAYPEEEAKKLREKSDILYAIRMLEPNCAGLNPKVLVETDIHKNTPSMKIAKKMFPGEKFTCKDSHGHAGTIEIADHVHTILHRIGMDVTINVDTHTAYCRELVSTMTYDKYINQDERSDYNGMIVKIVEPSIKVNMGKCNYLKDMTIDHINELESIIDDIMRAPNEVARYDYPEMKIVDGDPFIVYKPMVIFPCC